MKKRVSNKKEKGALVVNQPYVFTGEDGHGLPFKIYAKNWREFLDILLERGTSNNLKYAEAKHT